MRRKILTICLAAALSGFSGCDLIDDLENELDNTRARKFTVRVENVSMPGTITSDRAGGTVPLSPGAYAVYMGDNPMFHVDQPANNATARIAEDGFPMMKAMDLKNNSKVSMSGTFDSPGGPDMGPALFAGEVSTFTVTAKPGDRLQLQTMFVQSNDWFYAFGDNGLALFNGNSPVSGDMTDKLVLYDAGTETDTAPGTGPYQKPVQDPLATNVRPDDTVNRIKENNDRHPGFTIPAKNMVIRITITPQ